MVFEIQLVMLLAETAAEIETIMWLWLFAFSHLMERQ
jgi:hypothetical protein